MWDERGTGVHARREPRKHYNPPPSRIRRGCCRPALPAILAEVAGTGRRVRLRPCRPNRANEPRFADFPMNIEAAREQMIDQQVHTWDVLDERVLDAMRQVHREQFVPQAWRE